MGYLLDLMSGQPTGLFTFLAVFTFLVGKLVASLVEVRGRAAFVLFAMGADMGHGVLAGFFTWLTTKERLRLAALLSGLPAAGDAHRRGGGVPLPPAAALRGVAGSQSSAGLLR